jgi:hypothetical protein
MSQTSTTAAGGLDPGRPRSDGPVEVDGAPAAGSGTRRALVWFGRHRVIAALIVIACALAPWEASFASALLGAGGASLSARAAEWARDHGGASTINWIENVWYSHHAPPEGGRPPTGAIPLAAPPPVTAPATAAPDHLPPPPPIVPPASPALPGEGTWRPAGRSVEGVPAVYEAYLRPDSVHTRLVSGVAWMDTRLLRAELYSGSYVPGSGPWSLTAPVGPSDATGLVAAFNSGFRLKDAQGGYYSEGRLVAPLRGGAASFVIYRDGSATVADWGRDAAMGPAVVAVRQNLRLLVDGGAPVPGLADNRTWGATVRSLVYVWRSGVGVTSDGALVYAAGPGLDVPSLASLLARAGAVRAMELDINYDWVNFSAYMPADPSGPANAANGRTLLGGMHGGPSRYFVPWWDRDFIAMFSTAATTPGPPHGRGR